jgi:hypothetical protein
VKPPVPWGSVHAKEAHESHILRMGAVARAVDAGPGNDVILDRAECHKLRFNALAEGSIGHNRLSGTLEQDQAHAERWQL